MLPTLIRRAAQAGKDLPKQVPFSLKNNPYKARKVWPPDFKELAPQQQLRFEKKYKRRIMLASRSPRWDKGVKYAQLLTLAGAMIWLFFYAEFEWWGRTYKPSEEIHKKAMTLFGVMDKEKRYERRRDAPLPPEQDEQQQETKLGKK